MYQLQILISGDYSFREFEALLAPDQDPALLVPMDRLMEWPSLPVGVELVVIAWSRRNQWSQRSIELLQQRCSPVPLIGIHGSWCEGELRSGNPVPGIPRILWHQWRGQIRQFTDCLDRLGVTPWHLPPTVTASDRIQHRLDPEAFKAIPSGRRIPVIGISALSRIRYEMVSDAVATMGFRHCWLEQADWQAPKPEEVAAICLEGDGCCPPMLDRARAWKQRFPTAPMVALLNFPRYNDLQRAQEGGIDQILSKPFRLLDLQIELQQACGLHDMKIDQPKTVVAASPDPVVPQAHRG